MSYSYNLYNGKTYMGFCKITEHNGELDATILLVSSQNNEFASITNHLPVMQRRFAAGTDHKNIILTLLHLLLPDIQKVPALTAVDPSGLNLSLT